MPGVRLSLDLSGVSAAISRIQSQLAATRVSLPPPSAITPAPILRSAQAQINSLVAQVNSVITKMRTEGKKTRETLVGKALRGLPSVARRVVFPGMRVPGVPRMVGRAAAVFGPVGEVTGRLERFVERPMEEMGARLRRIFEQPVRRWRGAFKEWVNRWRTMRKEMDDEIKHLENEIRRSRFDKRLTEQQKKLFRGYREGIRAISNIPRIIAPLIADVMRRTAELRSRARGEIERGRERIIRDLVRIFQQLGGIPRGFFERIARQLRLTPAALGKEIVRVAGIPGLRLLEKVGMPEAAVERMFREAALQRRLKFYKQLQENMRMSDRASRELRSSLRQVWDQTLRVGAAFQESFRAFSDALMRPLSILHQFHMAVRRVLFSVLLFWYSASRFVEPAAKLIRTLQAATIIAGESFDRWGRSLTDLARIAGRFAIPVENVANAFKEIAKAGFSAKESQEILNASLAYATVLNEDMVSISRQVITVLKAWNIPATRATEVVTLLYNAVTKSKLSVDDLGTALNYAAASASAFGISMKESLAYLMYWADQGVRASRIGTGFRRILGGLTEIVRVSTGSQMSFADAVEVLGINSERIARILEEEGSTVSALRALFEDLHRAVQDGISSEERAAIKRLFGLRAMSLVIKAAKDLNRIYGDYNERLSAQVKLTERAEEVSRTWAGFFTTLNNLWVIFRAGVVEGLGEVFGTTWAQLSEHIERIKGIGVRIGEMIRRFLEPILGGEGLKGVSDWITKISELAFGFLRTFLPSVKSAFEILFGPIEALDLGQLGEQLGAIVGGILEGSAKVAKWVISIIKMLSDLAGDPMKLKDFVSSVAELFLKIKLVVSGLLSPFRAILGLISQIVNLVLVWKAAQGMIGGGAGMGGLLGRAAGAAAGRGVMAAAGGGILKGIGGALAGALPFAIPVAAAAIPLYFGLTRTGFISTEIERAMAEREEEERRIADLLSEGQRLIDQRRREALLDVTRSYVDGIRESVDDFARAVSEGISEELDRAREELSFGGG